ncbi:MAG: hypothetical protein AAB631_00955 [Patescibacteria group bacterium]|mgnify:CR=1 FL=1
MKIFTQRKIIILLAVAGFFFVVSLGILLLNIARVSGPLILHFDAFHGIDLFGSVGNIAGMWIMAFAMAIINLFLADLLYFRERVLSYAIVGMNVLISVFLFILMAVIASVN